MLRFSASIWSWILFYVLGLFYINFFGSQAEFTSTFLTYAFIFCIYLYFVRIRGQFSEKRMDNLALIFHLVPLLAVPTLSPDIYRFIWDGELITQGINPYSFTPRELKESDLFKSSEYLNVLYSNITELSKSHYSPYPTINQVYFIIPSFITENILAAVIIMKMLVLTTGILGYIYLKKILKLLKLPVKNAWILAINPFIIIELSGNLHFEGVMLSWLFIAFYFILTKKWILAALFWAVAINVKLTPLILLPFLWRYIGWKSAIKMYFLVGVFTVLLLGILLWPTVLPNLMNSIELYFNNFQFNSSLFSIVEFLLYPIYDYKTIIVVGPLLSKVSLLIICFLAIFRPIETGKAWFDRMLWGYVVYLLFSTTVHPWYIVFPFGLSILTKNAFMIGWTFLVMLSYGFYSFENDLINQSLIIFEYSGLLILILMDLFFKRKQHFLQRFLKL